MAASCEVRIKGRLSEALHTSFAALTPRTEVVTVLGPVGDAFLHGLLERVQALGLELVDIRHLPLMNDGSRAARRRRPARSSAAKVALLLLVVAGLLVALSLITRYGAYRAEVAGLGPGQVAAWKTVMKLFDVNSESNVPTWFSSLLLFGDALFAGLIAAMVRRAGGRDARHWAGLAVVLLLLSLDEVAALHERLQGPAGALLGSGARGPLHFAWVVPGVLLVLVAGAAFGGFVARLPKGTRRLVVTAGAIYVTAAVGLEAASGIVLEAHGDRALYLLVTAAEEGLEMCGAVLLLYAAMRLLHLRPEPGGAYHLSASGLAAADRDAVASAPPMARGRGAPAAAPRHLSARGRG